MTQPLYKTILCETCGKPTTVSSTYDGTNHCNNCWEVEMRLSTYLKSVGGQAFVRQHMPLLDDWADGRPDAWDYEAVLSEHKITVEWCDTIVDNDGNHTESKVFVGWSFYWKHGCIFIGPASEIIARKAAAMFVSLWLRGVSASFADKLMDGYIVFLERQEE